MPRLSTPLSSEYWGDVSNLNRACRVGLLVFAHYEFSFYNGGKNEIDLLLLQE
jgi:hypothetical protein